MRSLHAQVQLSLRVQIPSEKATEGKWREISWERDKRMKEAQHRR